MKKIILALFAVIIMFTSCKKKFETPTRADAPAVSSFITIDSIYQRFKTYYVTPTVSPTQIYRFSGDVTLECIVTADEVRALVGVISMAPNVSKGVITTTSEFAPQLLDDEDIRRLVPHRLELKPRNVLLPWLESLRKY